MNKPAVIENKPHIACHRRGLTLIELLVVVALALLFLGLIAAWCVSLLAGYKARQTAGVMAATASLVSVLKAESAIQPDHRLANYYWVDTTNYYAPAVAIPPYPTLATSRRMSSTELVTFLASQRSNTSLQLEVLGPSHLRPTLGVDGGALPPENQGVVQIYEEAPSCATPDAKQAAIDAGGIRNAANALVPWDLVTNPRYRLLTPAAGWRLRGIFDAWEREMAYRFYTDAPELNAAGNAYETIAGDEQFATPVEEKGTGGVRPAVAAHPYPFLMSAGKDGKWGAFQDGTAPDFARDATAPDKRAARDQDAFDNIYSIEERAR